MHTISRMDPNFRFGIWERLAAIALLAGVAGVMASMTLPSSYQEHLAQTGLGIYLFWISVAIIGLSVLFFVCDLALHIALKKGVKLGMALLSIGTVLIVVGFVVGLIGAFKFDESEEKSRAAESRFPIGIHAVMSGVDYSEGAVVGGISWKNGYSHVQIIISNPTNQNYTDLDVLITPEKPIIKAAAHAEFSECRIGPLFKPPPVLVVGQTTSGKQIGMPAEDTDENVLIGPPYRLVCNKLLGNAQIIIDLATVEPIHDVMSRHMWAQERHDPSFVDVQSSFTVANDRHTDNSRLSFAGPNKS